MADTFSPAASGSSDQPPIKGTTTDAYFWYAVYECTDKSAKIDYDKLAAMCRYKNGNSAQTMISYKRRQMQPQGDCAMSLPGSGVVNGGKLAAVEGTAGQAVVKRGRKRKDPPVDGGLLLKRQDVKEEADC